jgi:hypothetical protein
LRKRFVFWSSSKKVIAYESNNDFKAKSEDALVLKVKDGQEKEVTVGSKGKVGQYSNNRSHRDILFSMVVKPMFYHSK